MLVALVAVLKSGAAYLPLDPTLPAERLQVMLNDARPVCTITTSELASKFSDAARLLVIDDTAVSKLLVEQSDRNRADNERTSPLWPTNAAYVIYTSGSTGLPREWL